MLRLALRLSLTSHCRYAVPLVPVGCYRDNPEAQQVFSNLFLNYIDIDWSAFPNMTHVIQACARAAVARGYRIFSIQFYTQCRWGPTASRDYAKMKTSQGCYNGLGSWESGFVYRVSRSGGSEGKKELPDLLLRSSVPVCKASICFFTT